MGRLAELNAITRAHGRPYLPTPTGEALREALPEFCTRAGIRSREDPRRAAGAGAPFCTTPGQL